MALPVCWLVIGLTLVVSAIVIRSTDSDDNVRSEQTAAEAEPQAEGEEEARRRAARGPGSRRPKRKLRSPPSAWRRSRAANAAGKFGGKVAETTSPAAGWIGSQIMNPTADDWEPVHRG